MAPCRIQNMENAVQHGKDGRHSNQFKPGCWTHDSQSEGGPHRQECNPDISDEMSVEGA